MPFVFKKVLDHGTTNPIVARLNLQTLKLLEQCDIAEDVRHKVGELYVNSLQRKLLRCWEIEQRFRDEFDAAVVQYEPPAARGQSHHIPQIARLEEECHNFLYEAKNYIRDFLKVVNLLYGTKFSEASEFSRAKKRGLSLVDWASKTFGEDDPKTKFLREAISAVECLVDARNAVEHPGGYSGTLRIDNFALEADGKVVEPIWHREKNGKVVDAPSSIRADMKAAIHNLLLLAEDVLASWTADHLKVPELMRVAVIPSEQRDRQCPVKYVVTISVVLERELAEAEEKKAIAASGLGRRP